MTLFCQNLKFLFLVVLLCFISPKVFAVEYYELEVYGYQTANLHELEIENTSSVSSDDRETFTNRIFRSSMEFNYGISDRWELSTYLDYTKPVDDHAEYTAFRAHARTYFAEKDQLPVDLGLYFEVELPRNYRAKDVGLEIKPILEKDFSRWTIRLNPAVEFSHVAVPVGDNSKVVDPDGDVISSQTQDLSSDKVWIAEWGLSSSISYNFSEYFRPHLDWHLGFTDQSSLIMPSVDLKLAKDIKASIGAGFGLTPTTENRIVMARLEFESFLEGR